MIIGTPRQVSAIKCPKCSKTLDGLTQMGGDGATPRADDITLCAYCGTLSAYSNDAPDGVRALTDEDLQKLPNDVRFEINKARYVAAAMRALIKRRQ